MTNLSYLTDGWLELESDPGLFTLLIEDFGCKNVQVDEIYDLSKVGLIDGQVYGFIFLFKWTEERRSRNRSQMFVSCTNQLTSRDQQEPYYVEDENLVNSIFFAHQVTPNSCATHALLSVLLNCDRIELGDNLSRLKELTNSMDPESKGLAIGNMPELARAHNLHASEIDTQEKRNKQSQINKTNGFPRQTGGDSFHFISFVNINNRVYELDGLKKYPIDHGPISENETFSEKFRRIILERIPQQQQKENKLNSQLRKLQTDMNTQVNEEIRYSLMAVVPDRKKEIAKRLKFLKSKRSILLEIIQNLAKRPTLPEPYDIHSYSKYTTTLSENRPLEVNVNKLVVKDVNYNNQQLNSSKLTNSIKNAISLNLIKDNQGNSVRQDEQFDDDSTDTCSDCESRPGDEESDQGDKIESFYAFKFIPLREQNNDKKVDKKSIDETNFKTFTKSELIEFYRDYGFQDLINILNKIDLEITLCDRNINEETEKRTKFYVDDSRRTHNYNEFITTYLLMITEQKKLHEFIDSKEGKTPVTNAPTNSSINEQQLGEDAPIKFFRELISNYEDVLMNDESELMATGEVADSNVSTHGLSISPPKSSNDSSINTSADNSSLVSCNRTPNDSDIPLRRVYPKRVSKPKSNVTLAGSNVKRREKTK